MEDKATSLRTRLMVEMPSDNDLRAEGMSAAATPARAAAGLASVLSVLWAASGVSTAISASEKVASASENDALALESFSKAHVRPTALNGQKAFVDGVSRWRQLQG